MRALLCASLATLARGHGAMTFPKPRQALDGALAPWSDWAYPCDERHENGSCIITFCEDGTECQGSCPVSAHVAGHPDALNASNGQACYWFSNGCTIGCDACDGTTNHVGHGGQQFLYMGLNASQIKEANLTIGNPFEPAPGTMVLEGSYEFNITSNCAAPATKATVCDPRLRTCNTQAACGGPDDFYYHSPWRAPGSAPVVDACGSAGGRFPGQGIGPAGAQFQNSSLFSQGDAGSTIPKGPSAATWKAGEAQEVGWTVMANHGGGYAYRLARADEPLTEANFRKLALDFVGDSALRWGGDKAAQLAFDAKARGWETRVGTTPAGSTWRKNPIPSGLWQREGPAFAPVCDESEDCIRGFSHGLGAPQGTCKCSGYSNNGPLLPNLEVVDEVMIPADLAPGDYVLQWRWDCEESDQIWASCADVTVVA